MSDRTYFVLSRVSAFQENDLIVVDRQEMHESRSDDEVEIAFHTFTLAEFAAEYAKQLRTDERLVAVSKVLSIREPGGNSFDIVREDLKLSDNPPTIVG